ncbi:MAG: phosphoserine phosphatase SerB [Deltaproteobacteria bacterium]|nr:phosphoserine phosphatase SerB [Deltaproteobacteria bacterium]
MVSLENLDTLPQRVLVTVTGPDHPGITAALAGVLADKEARLLDIEQVVVQGQLTLCLLVGFEPGVSKGESALKDLLFTAKRMGLDLSFRVLENREGTSQLPPARSARFAVTAIGDGLDAAGVQLLAEVLAKSEANIETIQRLSSGGLHSLEIVLSLPVGDDPEVDGRGLRRALIVATEGRDIDVAVQRERLTRRAKRLVVFDMDSTLIQIEVIDELARRFGIVDKVAAITERAMQGELDYEQSLRERVKLLAGMPYADVLALAADLPVTQGVPELLSVLRKLGYKTAVISGGFTFAANTLKERLGLDYAYANHLEVEDGKLTGRVKEPVVTPQRKADLLDAIAQREGIDLEQTIAVGDGANDMGMLERAGLGIAFHAKAKLKEAADTSVDAGGLDRILFLLGLRTRDIETVLSGE